MDLPCSSYEIRQHIRRAYFQARLWLESAARDASQILDVTEYGYDSNLSPTLFVPPQRPLDIPEPCKYVNPVSESPAHAYKNNMHALTIANVVKCAKIQ